jgi:hypothetical protein
MPDHRLILGLLLGGCSSGGGPETPCEAQGDPSLEIGPADVPFGDFSDGDDLEYGTPPQGGAPYTPLKARASGLPAMAEGVTIEMTGVSELGEYLGDVTYDTRFVCANVGDSAGTWVASDLHYRYFGWDLDALEGKEAEITVTVTDVDGASVEDTLLGFLVLMD